MSKAPKAASVKKLPLLKQEALEENNQHMHIEKPKRTFVAKDCSIHNWDSIKEYFESLENRVIDDETSAESWLADRSELDAFLEEDLAWRYIRMSIDTNDKARVDAYTFLFRNST